MAAAVIRTQHRWREGFVCDTMKMIDKIRNFPFKGTVIVAVWAMVYGVFREPLSHLLAGPLGWWVGRGAILVGAVSSIWGAAWMIAQTAHGSAKEVSSGRQVRILHGGVIVPAFWRWLDPRPFSGNRLDSKSNEWRGSSNRFLPSRSACVWS